MDAVSRQAAARRRADGKDLCFYWNDREAAVGFASSYGVALHREQGLASSPEESVQAFEEGACWTNPDAARARPIGEALRRLSPEHVQVLYAAFGPRNPAARTDVLDEMTARVAPYTTWLELRRVAIVDGYADARVSDTCEKDRTRTRRRPARTDAVQARIDRLKPEIVRLRERGGERGLSAEERGELRQLRRELRYAERALEEATREPIDPETVTRLTASHRRALRLELGPWDVLRHMFGGRLERENGESWEAVEARRARVLEAMAWEIRRLKEEADSLLCEALNAYAKARVEAA